MNERIKKLRKVLGLTQQEFADKIGMKRNTVASYEINRNGPSNSVISLICKTFNVSETWLRTGEGDMFLETPDTAMGQLAKELGLDEFMQGVVSEYLKLNEEQRKFVREFVNKIAEQPIKEPAVPTPTPSQPPEPIPDLAAEVAKLKRQNEEMAARITAMEEEDAILEAAERSSQFRETGTGVGMSKLA